MYRGAIGKSKERLRSNSRKNRNQSIAQRRHSSRNDHSFGCGRRTNARPKSETRKTRTFTSVSFRDVGNRLFRSQQVIVLECPSFLYERFSGKNCDGAIVSFHDGSIRRQMLSWAMLRKLLQFKEQAHAHDATSGQQTERQP